MKNALCLITFKPDEKLEYLNFLNCFENLDIYVIIDDNLNNYDNLKNAFKNINFIQIHDNECINNGYKNLNYIVLKKPVSGWDKAIYYFTKNKADYSNIWFIEDDVYFYSEKTILQIDEKYREEDILCNASYDEAKLNEWLWKYIDIKFDPPYFCGMMCAVRLSKKYLECINDYVNKHNTLFFLEAFFPSIAKHYNLKIVKWPIEFGYITYRDPVPNHNDLNINFLYHPIKDIRLHSFFRIKIQDR
jgi:hypothetical protein